MIGVQYVAQPAAVQHSVISKAVLAAFASTLMTHKHSRIKNKVTETKRKYVNSIDDVINIMFSILPYSYNATG